MSDERWGMRDGRWVMGKFPPQRYYARPLSHYSLLIAHYPVPVFHG